MKLGIVIGIVIGWALSFCFGWTRRAHYEYKEFMRGYELGRKKL